MVCAGRLIRLKSPVLGSHIAGNRHAGFGEQGMERWPREGDCGPTRITERAEKEQPPPADACAALWLYQGPISRGIDGVRPHRRGKHATKPAVPTGYSGSSPQKWGTRNQSAFSQ